MRPFNLIQITDCHLGSTPGEQLLGLDTDQSLCDVLDMIQALESPDMILATGDISNDAGVASYERFVKIVRDFFPGKPIAWLPGNHDDPTNMDMVKDLPIEAHTMVNGWNLIFLDSRIPMEEGGNLEQPELDLLESQLSKRPNTPTIVFLHHQPVPVGSKWVDQYVVKNADAFFSIVDKFDNVRAISWGHVHQEFNSFRNGVALMATPSTCVQFTPKSNKFKVDAAMPGYRSYQLYENGCYNTCVNRVEERGYAINFASTGY